MTVILLLAIALQAAALGLLVGLAFGWLPPSASPSGPAGWLDRHTRHRMLVQCHDGQTVEGVITRVDHDGVELHTARWTGPDPAAASHDLSGAVWVPRTRIAWVQQPDPAHTT